MPMITVRTRLLLAALALTLVACGSKEDRIESGLKKGAEFARQSDWDKAGVEVRNVLQIDPKNARAYLIAAQVSDGQREPKRAYGQYQKALELQPDLTEAKTGLARLYLFVGDLARAQTSVTEVLAAEPANVTARTLQAAILARAGKATEALALAKQVLADGKAPADASLLLAGLHANQREWPQALAVLEAALKAEPRHLGLLQAAVEVAAANPQDSALADKAVGFFQRATAEAPKSQELWLAWARYHHGRKEVDKAEAVLRNAIKAQPEDGKRTLALIDFLQASRGAEAAEKQYRQSIADKPRDMALRFGLANLYRGTGRPAQAQQLLQEIIEASDDVPNIVAARTQLAAYRLAAGQRDEAAAQLAHVLKANPRDSVALVLRARMQLQAGSPRDAIIDLRAALRDQPAAVEIVQLLAQAHRSAGEPQLARDALAEAVKSRPEDAALRALLAADMADAKDFKSALAELDNAIKALPRATQLYELKAQIAFQQNDFVTAHKTLEQLKIQKPGEATAYMRLAQMYTGQRKFDLALKEYDAAAAADPKEVSPYVASVGLLGGLKRYGEAQARIVQRSKTDPGNAVLHQQLSAELALAQRDFVAAEKGYRAVIAAAPTLPNGYLNVAKVLDTKGDSNGALAVLVEGEKALPRERSLPMTRADVLTRLKRYDDAIGLYDELRTRFPDDDAVINNLAYLLAEVKGDKTSTERALGLAGRLANSRNPGHLDSLGWIHYQLGQYDKAVPLLERAVALAPTSALLQMHLGKALVKHGDVARGKVLLKKAIDSKADLPRVDEARALLAQS